MISIITVILSKNHIKPHKRMLVSVSFRSFAKPSLNQTSAKTKPLPAQVSISESQQPAIREIDKEKLITFRKGPPIFEICSPAVHLDGLQKPRKHNPNGRHALLKPKMVENHPKIVENPRKTFMSYVRL